MKINGRFGSLYGSNLVVKVPDSATWYVVRISDKTVQWSLYTKDVEIWPTCSGNPSKLVVEGIEYSFPCWLIDRAAASAECMAIEEAMKVKE